jgi:hypothetical protein
LGFSDFILLFPFSQQIFYSHVQRFGDLRHKPTPGFCTESPSILLRLGWFKPDLLNAFRKSPLLALSEFKTAGIFRRCTDCEPAQRASQ